MTAVAEPRRRDNDELDQEEFEIELARTIMRYIREADAGEDERRRSDRIGGNLLAGRHWDTRVDPDRAALTVNYARALILQLISLQTKQDPIWVVAPDDAGDRQAARAMQSILPKVWDRDDMAAKLRNAMLLGESTRTCAAKTVWDESLDGFVGNVTTDIIPGWRLILDPKTANPERMRYIGDRALMSRADAMLLYPEAADIIEYSGEVARGGPLQTGGADSPIKDQFKRFFAAAGSGQVAFSTGGAVVNGQPVVTAFTGRDPYGSSALWEVEVIELYHRDYTMIEREMPVLEKHGNPKKKMKMTEDGKPSFSQNGDFDEILGEPGFTIDFEDEMETKVVPMYPQWRRTTMLSREGVVIEDIAWDHPQPYELYMADQWLEGPWCKGTILDCLDNQLSINVSLSIMQDNLRFGSYRVFKRTSNAPLTRNSLVFRAGQVIDVGQQITNLEALDFPKMEAAWFQWVEMHKKFMREIVGVDGIMSGSAADAPRTDNSKGFDTLAELGGSRISSKVLNMERFISGIGNRVGYWVQQNYDERHAVGIEDHNGELTWERLGHETLMGTFSYSIVCGSTTAWSGTGQRQRVLEDMTQGLRDKISVCKALDSTSFAVHDWREIKARNPNWNMVTPPPRTRASAPKQPGKVTGKK
jgi:hypothetical protein